MIKAPEHRIPPEAAAIMARMVRMPPKQHKEMKLGKHKAKASTKANLPKPAKANPSS